MTGEPPVQLVIFDCDGVLVDSEPIANPLLARALRAEGLNLSDAEVTALFVGRTMDDVVKISERRLGRALPADFLDRLQETTFDAFRRELRAFPGAREAVTAVRDLRVKACVASNGSLDKMRVSLGVTGLIDLFDGAIFSREMVVHGKPAPDLFLHAAAAMEVGPGACLVIEDSASGIEAARAAGMRALRFEPQQHCAGPDVSNVKVITDLAQVARSLQAKNR